jgi:site-specific recombinase XerD
MKKRGRTRSSDNFPSHIKDPTKLPSHTWYNKSGAGKWMLDYYDAASEKWRSKRIAGPLATMSEIWQAYDAQEARTETTFKSLSLDFQKSLAWRDLERSTQNDYLGCHKKIINCKTGSGLFGDLPIDKWTVGTVRTYRDFRAEESRSRANKELSYIKRVFSWAYEYEKVKNNPAKGIKKLTVAARKHYAEDSDYNFLLQVARESNYWYMPFAMEIAYLCRMRLSEVVDFTDADERPEGLHIRRRKGSKDNITEWSQRLENAWKSAKEMRNKILTKKRIPAQFKPEDRYIFISERTGDRLVVSSFKTAKSRIDQQATKKAKELGIEFEHFTFHDLKRKGVTDTTGNKQEASGHRNASMLNIYDVKPSLVRPAGE